MDNNEKKSKKEQNKPAKIKKIGCFTIVGYLVVIALLAFFILHGIVFFDNTIWGFLNLTGLGGGLFLILIQISINQILIKKKKSENKSAFRRSVNRFISIVIITSIVFSCIPPLMLSAKTNIKNVFGIEFSENNDENKSAGDTDVHNPVDKNKKQAKKKIINKDITFVLDVNSFDSNDIETEKVLYFGCDELSPDDYLESIRSENLEYKTENYIYDFSLESDFLLKKNNAELYATNKEDYDKWIEMLPRESELLRVIDCQEDDATLYPSYDIYYRLSNNYQMLALEYYHQNKLNDIVEYYYKKSILNDIKCIMYAETDKQFRESKERMYYRFSDILYCGENTEEETQTLNYLVENLR